jgi:hypothetical protein
VCECGSAARPSAARHWAARHWAARPWAGRPWAARPWAAPLQLSRQLRHHSCDSLRTGACGSTLVKRRFVSASCAFARLPLGPLTHLCVNGRYSDMSGDKDHAWGATHCPSSHFAPPHAHCGTLEPGIRRRKRSDANNPLMPMAPASPASSPASSPAGTAESVEFAPPLPSPSSSSQSMATHRWAGRKRQHGRLRGVQRSCKQFKLSRQPGHLTGPRAHDRKWDGNNLAWTDAVKVHGTPVRRSDGPRARGSRVLSVVRARSAMPVDGHAREQTVQHRACRAASHTRTRHSSSSARSPRHLRHTSARITLAARKRRQTAQARSQGGKHRTRRRTDQGQAAHRATRARTWDVTCRRWSPPRPSARRRDVPVRPALTACHSHRGLDDVTVG